MNGLSVLKNFLHYLYTHPSQGRWLLLGLFSLFSLILSCLYERRKKPKLASIPARDLRLSPGQVSLLLLDITKAECILTATFLDWQRRGFIEKNSLNEQGFVLTDQKGPLLDNEKYLRGFLQKIIPTKDISFSTIYNYRKKYPEEFYHGLLTWFQLVEESLKKAGLIYKTRRNHGNALVYFLLSLALYFVGFIGLYQKSLTALLLIVDASLYFWLCLWIYNGLPPKGQAVLQALLPLSKTPINEAKKKLPFLDDWHIHLYTLSLGTYKANSPNSQKEEDGLLKSIGRTFVGSFTYYLDQ